MRRTGRSLAHPHPGRLLAIGGATTLGVTAAVLWVSTPATAFAHDKVTNPYLHTLLDVLSLAVVVSPVLSAYLWGARHRGLLAALVGVVQLPVAVIAFVPIVPPAVHLLLFGVAIALTIGSLSYVRRAATSPSPALELTR